MSQYSPLINSFTHGEISPYLYRRVDIDQYYSSAKSLVNFLILPYGGVLFSPGTYYSAEVKDSSKDTRLIPFSFNVEQTYMLEFGDQYIRFYMDDGQITSSGSPYEIASPYSKDDIFSIQYAQNADVMWLVHPKYKPKKLSRTGHTSWTLTDYTPTNDPFVHNAWAGSTAYSIDDYVIPTTANGYYYRCTVAGTSGSSEPTWPTTIGSTVTDGSVTWRCESSDPVNYPACVTFFEQRLWFAYTNSQPQAIFATKSGDFEDMTTGTADDDALQYTLGTNEVNVIRWIIGKRIMAIGTSGGVLVMGSNDATSPITPTNVMVHREVNDGCYPIMPVMVGSHIYYVHRDGKRLMEFAYDYTSDSYQSAEVSILSEHLFSSSIKQMAYQQSPYNMLWIGQSNGGGVVYTRNYLQKINGFAQRSTDGDIESVAVISRGDGDYDEVWMIVKREINGTTKRYVEYLKDYNFGTNIMDAFFVDCGLTYDGYGATSGNDITLDNTSGLVVVNASSAVFSTGNIGDYIKAIDTSTGETKGKGKIISVATSTKCAIQTTIDFSGLSYSGGSWCITVDSVSGLSHLEGKEVAILTDGAVHPSKTVSSGAISLEWPSGKVQVGLPYTGYIETLDLGIPNLFEPLYGRKRRFYRVLIDFYRTVGGQAGIGTLDRIYFRTTTMDMDTFVPMYDGIKVLSISKGWDREINLKIQQAQPLPMFIRAVGIESVIEGR